MIIHKESTTFQAKSFPYMAFCKNLYPFMSYSYKPSLTLHLSKPAVVAGSRAETR